MSASEWDIQVLRDLGISAAAEFATLDATVANRVMAEWSAQSSDVNLLVYRLRSALKAQTGKRASRLLDSQAEYGRQIAAWLERELPDVCDPRTGAHPAAVAAVIRLHHEHGRGLTKTKHGAQIRAFIRTWEERLLEPADRWFTNRGGSSTQTAA